MGILRRLSVQTKLLISYFTVAAILSCVAVYALIQIDRINSSIAYMYDNQLMPLSALGKTSELKTRLGRTVSDAFLDNEEQSRKEALAAIERLKLDFEKLYINVVVPQATSAEERAMADKIQVLFPNCAESATEAIKLSALGETEKSKLALGKMQDVASQLDTLIDQEIALNEKFASEGLQASRDAYQATFWLVTSLIVAGVITGLAIGWAVSRWFKGALNKVGEVAKAMSQRNFDIHIEDMGQDEVGKVIQALRVAVNSVKSALCEVRDVASTVSLAASQLSSSSQEIATGAQTQASSLEETASSLEEITSTVKQNSDNAQQARQLAIGSSDVAERGGKVVSQAVEAMDQINQSSNRIADIITTIDEIAFQTNLLALNAAVEAARAGEQGRGFAVVAAEVRNLAQRSAGSAKEIKRLIQDSVEKVANGTELVNLSGKTLGEIVASVKRVTDIVTEIAAASKEQLTGIEQVNKAVSQMDRVTQANANQTEEVSETAGSLLSHSKQLIDLVGKFRLDAEGNQATQRGQTLVRSREHYEVSPRPTTQNEKSEQPERDFVPAPIVMNSSPVSSVGVFEF